MQLLFHVAQEADAKDAADNFVLLAGFFFSELAPVVTPLSYLVLPPQTTAKRLPQTTFQKETGEVRAAPECLALQVLALIYKKELHSASVHTAFENFLSGASRL